MPGIEAGLKEKGVCVLVSLKKTLMSSLRDLIKSCPLKVHVSRKSTEEWLKVDLILIEGL